MRAYIVLADREFGTIENMVKPHVLHQNLELAYKEMAKDKKREEEADEWINGLIGDIHGAKR